MGKGGKKSYAVISESSPSLELEMVVSPSLSDSAQLARRLVVVLFVAAPALALVVAFGRKNKSVHEQTKALAGNITH
jgi:hypothetical protein